jgi:hypothetical protein
LSFFDAIVTALLLFTVFIVILYTAYRERKD